MRRTCLVALLGLISVFNVYAEADTIAGDFEIYRDEAGKPYFIATGLAKARQEEILGGLGLRPGEVPAKSQVSFESKAGADFYFIESSSLYRRSEAGVLDPGAPQIIPAPRKSTTVEIDVLGRRASVTSSVVTGDSKGVVERIQDSYGASRLRKHPYVLIDDHGPVMAYLVHGDRVDRILIGLQYVLELIYPDSKNPVERAVWSEKRLRTRDGKLLGSWTWKAPPPPRPGARLWSTSDEPQLIAEWDEELYPEGAAVLTLHRAPYLLIPRNPKRRAFHSVSLPPTASNGDFRQAGSADRLDYTEDEFRLWISVGGSQEINPAQQFGMLRSVLVTLPRLKITPEVIANQAARRKGGSQ